MGRRPFAGRPRTRRYDGRRPRPEGPAVSRNYTKTNVVGDDNTGLTARVTTLLFGWTSISRTSTGTHHYPAGIRRAAGRRRRGPGALRPAAGGRGIARSRPAPPRRRRLGVPRPDGIPRRGRRRRLLSWPAARRRRTASGPPHRRPRRGRLRRGPTTTVTEAQSTPFCVLGSPKPMAWERSAPPRHEHSAISPSG